MRPDLADEVARQLMAKDALGAHARDELGLSDATAARPVQAAFTLAATFTAGAAVPLILVVLAPTNGLFLVVGIGSSVCLALLGLLGVWVGGASLLSGRRCG